MTKMVLKLGVQLIVATKNLKFKKKLYIPARLAYIPRQEINELYAAESEDGESNSVEFEDASDRKIIFIFWFSDCKINKYLS